MKEYLEDVLHQSVTELPFENKDELPISCRNAFILNVIKIDYLEFLLAEPVENMNLTELRKMRMQLERYTGYICAFYLNKVNWYAVSKMTEEGIPFVWVKHQVYLPFMGVLLQENAQRKIKGCAMISFLTQKLLLKALYENWQDIPATKAASELGVSRMSITRCYDEIEALGMPFLKKRGRSRRFYSMENKQEMWNTMRSLLRNPIIRNFRLEQKPDAEMILGGTSALAEYSMLNEDGYITYAVTKEQIGTMRIKKIREVPLHEEPACIIQEMGYIVPFGNNTAVDPLSVLLTLTDEELEDPRVVGCVDEILEEFVW